MLVSSTPLYVCLSISLTQTHTFDIWLKMQDTASTDVQRTLKCCACSYFFAHTVLSFVYHQYGLQLLSVTQLEHNYFISVWLCLKVCVLINAHTFCKNRTLLKEVLIIHVCLKYILEKHTLKMENWITLRLKIQLFHPIASTSRNWCSHKAECIFFHKLEKVMLPLKFLKCIFYNDAMLYSREWLIVLVILRVNCQASCLLRKNNCRVRKIELLL